MTKYVYDASSGAYPLTISNPSKECVTSQGGLFYLTFRQPGTGLGLNTADFDDYLLGLKFV